MRSVGHGLLCWIIGVLATSDAAARSLSFDVSLDGRPIGQHTYTILRQEDTKRVESRAEFNVELLFFTAWRYRHANFERWQGDCLARVEATTDSNGERSRVTAYDSGEAFVVSTTRHNATLQGCIRSFAYWDPTLLRGVLLNPQTGEHLPSRLTPLPDGELDIGGRAIAVERYALSAGTLDITLAYDSTSKEWLGLDSVVEGGRRLSYRRSAGELDRTSTDVNR